MNKKLKIISFLSVIIIVLGFSVVNIKKSNKPVETKDIEATVISKSKLTIQDKNNVIYTFNASDIDTSLGANVLIEYTGLLDKNKQFQDVSIINCETYHVSNDDDEVPTVWSDNGIFSDFYTLANNKLKTMPLNEKIGQLFLVRYPDTNAIEDLKKYNLAGYIFFEKDFKNKTENEVKNMITNLQDAAKIPILTAVDEEGGKVVRVSSNTNLVKEEFKSSKELYNEGGFNLIKDDTIYKSSILKNLGLNLNLAPVVDVSTDSSDYIYERTLGENTSLTSTYAKTVIDASMGTGVSYTLKHFPGYGHNTNTHDEDSIDNRTYEEIRTNDLPPFKAGIDVGAEAILVGYNVVTSIDNKNPASLSASVHNLLRNNLDFTGIVMTDNLDMGALSNIDNTVVKAVLAGNDLIITTDYKSDIAALKTAVSNGTVSEELIDKLAFRVLAWKYYKGLLFEITK